jgi:hypothetical protein
VDVWREYASNFTLDQFFDPSQKVPPAQPPAIQPTEEEVDPLTQAIQVGPSRDTFQTAVARILRLVTLWMSRRVAKLEKNGKTAPPADSQPYSAPPPIANGKPEMKTAFEVINEMVKARLTKPFVDHFDDAGNRIEHHTVPSEEYKLLGDRGLKVLNVSITNPRLHPSIDEHLIEKWEANWLDHANAQKDQVQRRRSVLETMGQEQAVRKYAEWLSEAIVNLRPSRGQVKLALKTLLMRTKAIIVRTHQLRRKMSTELQEVDDVLRWIEVNGR